MARARIDKHSEREAERRRGAHLGVLVRILLGACGDHEHGVVVAHLEGTRRLLERNAPARPGTAAVGRPSCDVASRLAAAVAASHTATFSIGALMASRKEVR